ncbi:hypothetical protein C8Q72DRAFT_463133 [Fomitopsis betulina]|nr:hypothetical protein C8Q72DRAFT_463133 [Fomitopsis betulina]
MLPHLLLCFLSFWALACAQTQIQTFWPAAVPLAVRNPYLNVWQATASTNDYPVFWDGSVIGWVGFIRVDGSIYRFFGNNHDMFGAVGGVGCNVTYTEVTPTRTIQTVQAGPINVTLLFLSPIEPSDWVKQSMPFSYLAVDFASTDGKEHSVQIYSDISAEWVSAEDGRTVQWSTGQTGQVAWHSVELEQSQAFNEAYNQANDGIAFYAMSLGAGQSAGWQTCQDTVCYETFFSSGALSSTNDNDTFRAISTDLPVFAFSVDFGTVSATQEPVVWAVGHVRDPSIQYSLSGDVTSLRPLYTTEYFNITDVVEAFLSDYDNALSRAEALDAQIRQAAANIAPGNQYWNMLSLSARQVFGALDLTAPGSDGATRFFLKDIGLSGRVNPVSTLYAALPTFLYFNSSMVKPLLLPLLEQQNSSSYSASYAASDIGTSYPSISGATATESESVEQSANMLIMVLAHSKQSGDTSLIKSYYTLLKTWTNYLVSNALYPKNQALWNSGEIVSNSTNLAVKGILAIQAMSQISTLYGEDDDAQHYSSIAVQYIGTWKTLAISSDSSHVLSTYGDDSTSWTLPYSLFPHSLLSFDLLEDSVLNNLSSYYKALLPDYTYGPPIGSQNTTLGSAAWTSLAAATFTDTTTRQKMLSQLWVYANTTTKPFPSIYNVVDGNQINGTCRLRCIVCPIDTERRASE